MTLTTFHYPQHRLTECSLNHAAWLASMILPVNQEAVALQQSIEVAIATRDLREVEAALSVPMLEWQPKRKRGVVLAMWKGWKNQYLALNQQHIWSEIESAGKVAA